MTRWRVRSALGVAAPLLMVSLCLACFQGCNPFRGAVRLEPGPVRKREATRLELLQVLTQNMRRFYSLKAKASITVTRQDILVPETLMDDVRRKRGKPYRKKFFSADLNGIFLLQRDREGNRNVRFSGQIVAGSAHFMLVGKNDAYLIVTPPTYREEDAGEAPRGRVYVGQLERETVRPDDLFSIRPQDICDLFLYDEAFDALQEKTICNMERWDEFYILNFLRPDWRPEHLFSKIWFERDDLRVAIHQLFDGSGALIAEARFGRYGRYSAKGSEVEVEIPTMAELIWPRDGIIMEVALDNIKANEGIDAKYFEPKIPKGYIVEPIGIPAKDEGT